MGRGGVVKDARLYSLEFFISLHFYFMFSSSLFTFVLVIKVGLLVEIYILVQFSLALVSVTV